MYSIQQPAKGEYVLSRFDRKTSTWKPLSSAGFDAILMDADGDQLILSERPRRRLRVGQALSVRRTEMFRRALASTLPEAVRMILLLILVILVLAILPSWPYSRSWGYYPSGGLGTILVIVLILYLLGYLHF